MTTPATDTPQAAQTAKLDEPMKRSKRASRFDAFKELVMRIYPAAGPA